MPEPTITTLPNAGLCPLCGRLNGCQMCSATAAGEPCWCHEVIMPAELLARVPEAARNVACICRECYTAFQANRPQ